MIVKHQTSRTAQNLRLKILIDSLAVDVRQNSNCRQLEILQRIPKGQ